MKNRIFKFSTLLLAVCTFVSCNLLDTEPLDKVPANTFYKDQASVLSGLTGCYYGLYLTSRDGTWNLINFPGITDDGYTDHGTFQMFLINGQNNNMTGDLNTMYATAYDAIFKCNNFISMVSPTKAIDESLKNQYINEAKVLRAYYYFLVTNIFGDAVLTLKPETKKEEILKYRRISRTTIKDSMMVDLERAIRELPKESYQDGHIVSGTAAALAMRYKLMDYGTPDYAGIVSLFEGNFKVEGDLLFGMVTRRQYKSMFDGNTSKGLTNQDPLPPSSNNEVLFSIRYSKSNISTAFPFGAGITDPNNCPRPQLADFYQFNDGSSFSTSSPLYDSADPFKNRDERMGVTIINPNSRDTVVYMPKSDYLKDNPTGYAWKKCTPLYILYDRALNPGELMEQDIILIRFPEVLLMYAEALNEVGRTADAAKALNRVRSRFLPEFTGNTQLLVREAIRYERRAEFAQEGMIRYLDMQRLGLMKEIYPTLPVSVKNQSSKGVYAPRQRFWPIPEFERIANPGITQNDGY